MHSMQLFSSNDIPGSATSESMVALHLCCCCYWAFIYYKTLCLLMGNILIYSNNIINIF